MSLLSDTAKSWRNAGLGWRYPEVCQLCGRTRATPAEGYVCGGCRAKARFSQPPFCERCGRPFEGNITTQFECTNCREMEWHFQSARSAVAARDPVLEAIHRYKYQRALWCEPFLAGCGTSRAESRGFGPCPLPTPVVLRDEWPVSRYSATVR